MRLRSLNSIEQRRNELQVFIDEHKAATIDMFEEHLKQHKDEIEMQSHKLQRAQTAIEIEFQETEALKKDVQQRDETIRLLEQKLSYNDESGNI